MVSALPYFPPQPRHRMGLEKEWTDTRCRRRLHAVRKCWVQNGHGQDLLAVVGAGGSCVSMAVVRFATIGRPCLWLLSCYNIIYTHTYDNTLCDMPSQDGTPKSVGWIASRKDMLAKARRDHDTATSDDERARHKIPDKTGWYVRRKSRVAGAADGSAR
jgi:hypothetical protein